MTLGAHLVELRKRLTIAAVAHHRRVRRRVVPGPVCSVSNYSYRSPMSSAAWATRSTSLRSISRDSPAHSTFRSSSPSPLALVISSPVWLYQIWAFIVPGLKRKERRYVYGFLGSAIPLFPRRLSLVGGCCCHTSFKYSPVSRRTSQRHFSAPMTVRQFRHPSFVIAVGIEAL